MTSTLQIELVTPLAKQLVEKQEPRKGYGLVSLFNFASISSAIWREARWGSPWAYKYLLRVSHFIDVCEALLDDVYDDRLRQAEEMSNQVGLMFHGRVATPSTVELKFGNPYAFHAAHLIAKYDQVVRAVDSSSPAILTRRERDRVIGLATRRMRGVLHSVYGFKRLGLKEAFDARAPGLDGLIASMGAVNDIFSGHRQVCIYEPVAFVI